MNHKIPRALLLSSLAVVFVIGMASHALAQAKDPNWKPVTMKLPGGYMPAEFPEKRAGKLLLNPKKPAGMFIVYPQEGESPDVLQNLLKEMVAGMFFHDEKAPANWTSAQLPAHEGTENETGTLYSASRGKMEVQLAVYARSFGVTKVLYGYYGMREQGKKQEDAAPFMDAAGKGVEDFDKFWKSIKLSK